MKIENPKIILLHPGKTGGTSLEHTIRDKYLGISYKLNAKEPDRNIMFGFDNKIKIYLQHACLNIYKSFNVNFKEYKTITTVRRPYERILSCYFYNGKSTKFTFNEFVTKELEKCAYVSFEKEYACSHFAPQFYYTHLDGYVVDHIIKLENFNEDCEKAGIKVKYHYAKTAGMKQHNNPMDMYDKNMKDIVYNLYKEDFDLLGYER